MPCAAVAGFQAEQPRTEAWQHSQPHCVSLFFSHSGSNSTASLAATDCSAGYRRGEGTYHASCLHLGNRSVIRHMPPTSSHKVLQQCSCCCLPLRLRLLLLAAAKLPKLLLRLCCALAVTQTFQHEHTPVRRAALHTLFATAAAQNICS